MSRTTRLEAIQDIVRSEVITNQASLVRSLAQRGIDATQATVSRDVRLLGLVKSATPDGARYRSPGAGSGAAVSREAMRSIFRQSVTQIETGGALLVIKTPSGFGNAVAAAVDAARLKGVVGTVAGDDTILVVVEGKRDQATLLKQLRNLID